MTTIAEKQPIRLSEMRTIPIRRVRGRFDSARTTRRNRRHWANADGLSADAAANAYDRREMRNKARYEVANNSYALGIVQTLANDVVGTGPRLQLLTDNPEVNRRVEQDFTAWSAAIGLPEKLRTMRMARCQDGEAFAIMSTNPKISHPVRLNLELVEADQITSPMTGAVSDNEIDGILLDSYGNPIQYRVLKQHPGDSRFNATDDFKIVRAESMIHVFRQDRPGQHRGVPEINSAVELFAQLRRYTGAVLSSAEQVANISLVIYTRAPANGEASQLEPLDEVELSSDLATVMPDGWEIGQTRAEQPTTTYAEFKHEILNEIARCLNMPFNIAAGNSAGYNYSSGRLDHQTYFKMIRVDQAFMASKILDRILNVWLLEYALSSGAIRYSGNRLMPPRQWFWDGTEHIDPYKEAKAQEARLNNHTVTLAHEYAKMGLDWETELRQRAKEIALMRELGLSASESRPSNDDGESNDNAEDEEERNADDQ
jgi:lambda family phage portal protein